MEREAAAKLVFVLLCALQAALSAAASPVSYSSGPFTIHYDPSQAPTLRVTATVGGRADSVVWYTSISNQTFVTAAAVDQTVGQNGGTFVFSTSVREVCSEMSITRNGSRPSSSDTASSYDQVQCPLCAIVYVPNTPEKTGLCIECCGDETIAVIGDCIFQVYFGGLLCREAEFEMWFQAVDIGSPATPTTHLLFNLSLANSSGKFNQLRLTSGCEKDEQIFGFGAQYSKFNMKGERLPLFLSEQGVGRGLEPLTFVLDEVSPGAGKWPSDLVSQ